ncbi:unnamed protein product (mitochondrion) [Plasmodiophora brassicae]|uniref:RGS domain-containing protein n=1 Tax=Plasmodiophora brassicae TaxID=37360 RepID=A0A3P3YME0_PLABS|nr:unnamed protein product [Plasmodiophora brassicae]
MVSSLVASVLRLFANVVCAAPVLWTSVGVYRYRAHRVISWRGVRSVLWRNALLVLWITTSVWGAALPDGAVCWFRIANVVVLWSLLASISCHIWYAFVSWCSISTVLSDNAVSIMSKPGFLLRYRRALTSTPAMSILFTAVVALGSTKPIVDLAVHGAAPSNDTSFSWMMRCPGAPGLVTSAATGIIGVWQAVLVFFLRNVSDSYGVRNEVLSMAVVMFLTAITIVAVPFVNSLTAQSVTYLMLILFITVMLLYSSQWIPLRIALAAQTKVVSADELSSRISTQTAGGMVTNPVTVTFSNKRLTRKSKLFDVLNSDEGLSVLFKFCLSEFSVENVTYLSSSIALCTKYGLTDIIRRARLGKRNQVADALNPERHKEYVADCQQIVNAHLTESSHLQVNLPTELTQAVAAFLATEGSPVGERALQGAALLRRVDDAVYDLVERDTFVRFTNSELFRALVT